MLEIFPHLDVDEFRRIIFWLTYKRAPDGTGTNLTRNDCLAMEMSEILWWWEMLQEAWKAEDAARARASKAR